MGVCLKLSNTCLKPSNRCFVLFRDTILTMLKNGPCFYNEPLQKLKSFVLKDVCIFNFYNIDLSIKTKFCDVNLV